MQQVSVLTAVPRNPRVSELRELFRNYLAFRATYEECGLDTITSPSGQQWSLWDLDYLREQFSRLTLPQQQAINLCLIHNMRERDAAVAMGVSPTNPVAMYATLGLQRLLDMVDSGELQRFRENQMHVEDQRRRHETSTKALVVHIESSVMEMPGGCWLFPNRSPKPPKMLLRSARSASGFLSVSPAQVLFEHYFGPMPEGSQLGHRADIEAFSISCINPHHGQVTLSRPHRDRVQVLLGQYNRERLTR